MQDFEQSAKYFERAISEERYKSTVTEVSILLYLRGSYARTSREVEEVRDKLRDKFLFMMEQTPTTIYLNLKIYNEYGHWLQYDNTVFDDYFEYGHWLRYDDQFYELNERILQSMFELGIQTSILDNVAFLSQCQIFLFSA